MLDTAEQLIDHHDDIQSTDLRRKMSSTYPYIHIYTDHSGETHLEKKTFSLQRMDFSPPTPFLDVSDPTPAESYSVLRLPVDWTADWHPSPCRQWQLYLRGKIYFEVSSGANCVVSGGQIVLLEDTTGKGHLSYAVDGEEVFLTSIRIPDR